MNFCDIHLRAISQQVPNVLFRIMRLEIIHSKLLSHLPVANELKEGLSDPTSIKSSRYTLFFTFERLKISMKFYEFHMTSDLCCPYSLVVIFAYLANLHRNTKPRFSILFCSRMIGINNALLSYACMILCNVESNVDRETGR